MKLNDINSKVLAEKTGRRKACRNAARAAWRQDEISDGFH
jgi:hypothetical protein